MNFLSFIVFGSFFFGISAADCSDKEKEIVHDCYNIHFNRFNYTAKIYNYIFSFYSFTALEAKNNCTIFEELGNCISDERWNNCVTPELLGNILGKSKDDAADLIYIYRKTQIFCSYLPQLVAPYLPSVKGTTCYSPALNSCLYQPLSNIKVYYPNNCGLYPSYIDCSVRYIAQRCKEPYAKMHCDFMNLIVSTYQSNCNLKLFNCTKYNYTEERIKGESEYAETMLSYAYFGELYSKYVDSVGRYFRYFYATVFIAIFGSFFKKNSALKSSFYALFLLIPFYDVVYDVAYIMLLFPLTERYLLIWGVSPYLHDCYGTFMSVLLLVMSMNRFTAINFPLKHGKIWKPCVTAFFVAIIVFITIFISVIDKLLQDSFNITLTYCLHDKSLMCYLRENFDTAAIFYNYKIFRCVFAFSICGISIVLLCATIIRHEICLKNQSSDILKTAEKRLFLITGVEVIMTMLYTIFYLFPFLLVSFNSVVWMLHSKPVVFIHHFSCIALFFLFSKATRDAYIKFFYLDFLYKKVIKKYLLSKFMRRKDKVVSIAASTNDRKRTN